MEASLTYMCALCTLSSLLRPEEDGDYINVELTLTVTASHRTFSGQFLTLILLKVVVLGCAYTLQSGHTCTLYSLTGGSL